MLFLAGAFVTGGAVGYAADRAMAKPELASPVPQRDIVEELAVELRLRPDQKIVFDSVWAWRRTQWNSILTPVKPSLDSVRDSARVLMLNTLDSTQQAAFRRLIERNQRASDSTARARGEQQ
jgi:hypothetical protein